MSMDKTTAEKMVDYHAQKVIDYNSKDGNFIFGELQDSRAKLIEALTTPEPTDPTQTYYLPMYETGPATCRYCHQDYTVHGLSGRCQIRGCDLDGPPEATPSKHDYPLHDKFPVVWYEKDRIGVRIWDSGEFVFTCAEAQEIVNKLSALLNLDTPNLPDPLLEAAKAILEWYGPIEADCMVALSKEVKAREKVTE